MKACLFPGQGSQTPGMGEGLFARYPEMTAVADEILGYSVAALCSQEPKKLLQTQYTQPALYVVNALTWQSRCDEGAPQPDFVAGHSLGEYNALLAAEVFDFAAGLRLVKQRGELMSAVSGAGGGGMAAVLGCDWNQVEEILRQNGLHSIDVANYNSPTQVVLAGPAADIVRADAFFSETGATYRILNVSAAFHSRYMESCVQPLGEALETVAFSPPKIPVLSNVSARPHAAGEVQEHLRRQIREPVRWLESMRYLLDAGVEDFEEVGPGTVLAKLIKSIRKDVVPARAAAAAPPAVAPERLGSAAFRRAYNVRRAYVAGSMSQGIASQEMVVRLGKAGYLGFFGAGGLAASKLEEHLRSIRKSLRRNEPFGVGLVASPDDPDAEMAVVNLCLKHEVRCIEAAGFAAPSPALIRFRLKGPEAHRLLVKVSRPEVAEAFLLPAPERLVADLLRSGAISADEAEIARRIPAASDLCVEADGEEGGTAVLLPAILRLREEIARRHPSAGEVRIGSAGGIGTPEAAAAAFLLGADFILTGSVNQCTVEAGTSDEAKDLLAAAGVQDTESAPVGDLFEVGGRNRVLKKGVFFPARANKLHDLWRHHGSWDEIDAPTRAKIERDYFGRSFESVCREARAPEANGDGRHRMALAFRWYFDHSMRLAQTGAKDQKVNYQVRCGPALGAFNQWVKGTPLEPWRNRHVDTVADRIMEGAAEVLSRQLHRFTLPDEPGRS